MFTIEEIEKVQNEVLTEVKKEVGPEVEVITVSIKIFCLEVQNREKLIKENTNGNG